MWTKVVTNIIFERREQCRLCFTEVDDDDLRLHDEVILNMKTEKVSDLLLYVLGGKYTSNMTVRDSFCSSCVLQLKNCYNFMKMCKNNSDCLNNILDAVNESLKPTESMKSSKSILIHIDSTDFSFMQYYQYKRSVKNLPASVLPGHSKYLIHNKKALKAQDKKLNSQNNNKTTTSEDQDPGLESSVSNENRNTYQTEQRPEVQNISNLETQHSKLKTLIQNKISMGSRRHILKRNIKTSSYSTRSQKQMEETRETESQKQNETQEMETQENNEGENKSKDQDPDYRGPKANIIRRVPKQLSCEDCGKKYKCKIGLTYHTQMKHSTLAPHLCKYCGKTFKVSCNLRLHIRREHLEPCAQCDLCDATFKDLKYVYSHRKLHFNPKSLLYMPELVSEENEGQNLK